MSSAVLLWGWARQWKPRLPPIAATVRWASEMGRATGLESSDLIPLRRAPRGVPADGVLATAVVGGFVGKALVLVRAWHSCADAVLVSALRFDGKWRRFKPRHDPACAKQAN